MVDRSLDEKRWSNSSICVSCCLLSRPLLPRFGKGFIDSLTCLSLDKASFESPHGSRLTVLSLRGLQLRFKISLFASVLLLQSYRTYLWFLGFCDARRFDFFWWILLWETLLLSNRFWEQSWSDSRAHVSRRFLWCLLYWRIAISVSGLFEDRFGPLFMLVKPRSTSLVSLSAHMWSREGEGYVLSSSLRVLDDSWSLGSLVAGFSLRKCFLSEKLSSCLVVDRSLDEKGWFNSSIRVSSSLLSRLLLPRFGIGFTDSLTRLSLDKASFESPHRSRLTVLSLRGVSVLKYPCSLVWFCCKAIKKVTLTPWLLWHEAIRFFLEDFALKTVALV